jgi:arylformamidase
MQIYPGDPKPRFYPHATIKDDKVNVTRITLGSHTGTHVDAQWHFMQEGNSIDREPLSKFAGDAVIVDTSCEAGLGISAKSLSRHSDIIQADDILLIYTGKGSNRTDFAYLETSAAEWMVENQIKCIGIDTPSVEKYGYKDAPVHKLLLSNGIGIIENLDNLKQFVSKRMFLVCLPLPLKGVDGSPARAVLLEIVK